MGGAEVGPVVPGVLSGIEHLRHLADTGFAGRLEPGAGSAGEVGEDRRREGRLTDENGEGIARPRQELAAAQLLAENGFAAQAVSLAYYAAFYSAEAALLSLGETRAKHSGVGQGSVGFSSGAEASTRRRVDCSGRCSSAAPKPTIRGLTCPSRRHAKPSPTLPSLSRRSSGGSTRRLESLMPRAASPASPVDAGQRRPAFRPGVGARAGTIDLLDGELRRRRTTHISAARKLVVHEAGRADVALSIVVAVDHADRRHGRLTSTAPPISSEAVCLTWAARVLTS